MNYSSFQFSLKSRHCWRWNHFVLNIILALNTDQRSVFTFSSLVALLALLASILLIISSLFRFHNKYFRKFDCFTCHCGKMHFALNEIHTVGLLNYNTSILASKDNILEFGLDSGMRGHWSKQLVFLIPQENLCKNKPRISNVGR